MPINSVEIMKIVDERKDVIHGVLLWNEVIVKSNWDSKRCQ